MNKNLKKVISAVAALAVSASSIVAFAAGYPDVPETATYAQAVKELSALNVINGYEDGTFLPDKNVTRAEITKMIVTALGSSSLSAAEAATGKDTQFEDVKGTHWASGYVTVGTSASSQFINGYSDTSFGPDDNVTYAQAIKMLVAALGYTTYAENNGGWPNGYLTYGYNLDITKGVTGVSNDTQVTRAQVAQMIDNAIKAPICVVDGYKTQWNGTQTPNLVEKNTTSVYTKDSWQCLLNYSHDAYIVNGRVKATHQSDPGVDADRVNISIEKSNNYDGYQVTSAQNNVASIPAYIGDSDADDYLLTYAEMIVQMDDDDELTILSIVPAGSNKTASFAAEDFAEDKTVLESSKGTLYAYSNGSSTKTDSYRIDTAKIAGGAEGGFYVNGVQQTATLADCLTNFVENNVTGTVTLIDSPAVGTSSTDGTYDYIMVTYYIDAVVDSVSGSDNDYTISFSAGQNRVTRLNVDLTDEDMYYSFKLTDGTEISPADLQENDVLSIACNDITDFSNATSYDVIVSRDVVEGKVTSINPDTEKPLNTVYTIDGNEYKLASDEVSEELKTGYTYTLYLDAFGRYAKMEETAASKKIGLIDNVYTANGGQYYVTVVGLDGVKTNYTVKDEATYNTYLTYCFKEGYTTGHGNKLDVQERVYEYSISSSTNNITIKDKEDPKSVDGTYKESTNKIGSLRMNDAITSMLDLSEYYDNYGEEGQSYVGTINSMTSAALENDADYKAFGFNQLSDNSYQFVLVMNATGTYTYNTEFYVYSKTSTMEVDGEDKVVITAYKDADAEGASTVDIILDSEGIGEEDLAEGDPIVVKTDSSGYATEILPLFDKDVLSSYKDFSAAVRANLGKTVDEDGNDENAVLNVKNLNKALKHNGSKSDSDWAFGIVAAKSTGSITLATGYDEVTGVADYYGNALSSKQVTNVEEIEEIDYDTNVKFIVYDYGQRSGKQARVSTATSSGAVVASSLVNSTYVAGTMNDVAYTAKDKTLVAWDSSLLIGEDTATYGVLTFALVKTVDDEATEVYVIVPSTSKK